jgi:hypothetical protein
MIFCAECRVALSPAEGTDTLTCCEPCFIAITAPLSDRNSTYARKIRTAMQEGMMVVFRNTYENFVLAAEEKP